MNIYLVKYNCHVQQTVCKLIVCLHCVICTLRVFKALKEALRDTESTATTEPLEFDMLSNISNTMSDRVVTNKCIENLLAADKCGELINLKCPVHPCQRL